METVDALAMDAVAMETVDALAMDAVVMETLDALAMDAVVMETMAIDAVAMDAVAMDALAMQTTNLAVTHARTDRRTDRLPRLPIRLAMNHLLANHFRYFEALTCTTPRPWQTPLMLARCFASTTLASFLALPASAAVIEIAANRDTTLYESATGALGNGSGQYLFAGTTNQPQLRRALIAFDVHSALPENAIITSVTLRMHVASTTSLTNLFTLHRATGDWSEGASDATGNEGSGAAALTGDATWLHSSYASIFWNNAGGDFASVISASASVGDIGFYSWSSTSMIADLEFWRANPQSSFGWLLRGDESSAGTTRRFDSSESLTAGMGPSLMIEYTLVPAPGSIALIVLSSLMARGRRQRRS